MKSVVPAPVPEATDEDRIHALEAEIRLLRPFASTKGLILLKARLAELDRAVTRLYGLKLGD